MFTAITIKAIGGLISLLIVIRLVGKKELSQVTPFDFVYLLVLGGFLEEGMYDKNVTIFHIAYTIFLWGLLIYMIEKVTVKSEWFRKLLKGECTDIISNGKVNVKALEKNKMEMEQLRILLRNQGYFSVTEIEHATLETNGTLSILPKVKGAAVTVNMLDLNPPENEPTYLFVDEGEIKEKEVKKAGKTKEWLLAQLNKQGIEDPSVIYYGEWSETRGFYFIYYDK